MEKKSLIEAIEYSESRFTKRVLFNEGGSTIFLLNFMPGQELPTHTHPGSELFLHVIKGKGKLIINGKETDITEYDVIHAAGDEEFAFKNSSNEPVSLYVTLCKIPNDQYAQNI
ncbi:cupin domain-containing protein [Niallia endozanthoxylica]|uniref:Cupin domain-containing protein n=1 Tax=Niallia endozanthoxylica TaxID=2036016 RepID=A0A5J5HXD2_9BACI|nr:cupin domain-containing protein [Niallia endozanthoxylica]KAA9025762.1 cupin domain-containing protein [Niallia endozanthoxylica]